MSKINLQFYVERCENSIEDKTCDTIDANVSKLTLKAKQLLSEAITTRLTLLCIKNIKIKFGSSSYITLSGTIDYELDTLSDWISAINEKSIYQLKYGKEQSYLVESNGKYYKIIRVQMKNKSKNKSKKSKNKCVKKKSVKKSEPELNSSFLKKNKK